MMFFKYKPHKGLSSHPNHWLQEFKNHKSHRSQDHRTEGRKSSTIGLKNGDGSQSDTCSEESFVAGEFEDELEWQSGPQQGTERDLSNSDKTFLQSREQGPGLPLISKNSGKGIEHMIPAKKDLFQLTNPNPWSMQSLPRINARSNFSKITPKSEENLNRKTAQVYPVGMPARRLFDQRTKQLPQLPSPDGRESSKPYFKYSASHQENRGPLKQNFLLAEGDQQQVGYSATADGKNKKYQPVVDSALRGSHEKQKELSKIQHSASHRPFHTLNVLERTRQDFGLKPRARKGLHSLAVTHSEDSKHNGANDSTKILDRTRKDLGLKPRTPCKEPPKISAELFDDQGLPDRLEDSEGEDSMRISESSEEIERLINQFQLENIHISELDLYQGNGDGFLTPAEFLMFPPKSDCSGELSWHRNKNLDLSPTDFESSCASADSSSSNFSEIAKTRSEVSDSKIQRHDEIRNSPRLPTRSLPDKVHCLPKSSSHEKLQGKIYQESGVFSKNQESSCLVAGNKLAPQPWGHRRMGSLPSDSRPRLKFAKSFSDRTIGHSKESKYYYDNRTEEDGKIKNQTKTKNRPASNSVDASVPSSAIILPLCTKKTKQRVSHMSAAPRPLHGSLHSTGTYFCGKGVINIDKIFEKPRPAPLPSNFVHDEAHQ